ncbi:imidazolonepropionase-like domain-containing protein [Streptomyces sp.]|uniref:imidazolonepropionase-like domain-containing protein n=1 Tax=Streptomyces sp. TaxID=1931 RepID=UPI002F402D49
MLTLHTAGLLLPCGGRPPVPGGAVLVDGRAVAGVGPYEELAAAHPAARTRRWPGVLTPGLRQPHGTWLLTRCYHPDPREADVLGDAPLSGERFDALPMDAARRAGSVRRGVQRMLRHGTTAVVIAGGDPVVRDAVTRVGLVLLPAAPAGDPTGPPPGPDLDPFVTGRDLEGAVHAPLVVGGRADLAAFDVPPAEVAARGAGTCVATVLAGRLVYRRA